jgi:hypothetical protein
VAFVGLAIAAGGYWLIRHWNVDVLEARHNLGFVSLPVLDTDLAIAGLGLGLVIGPLTSAALRVVPSVQHGIASSAVVVARMTGMLVGVAALSAWGLYRFNQILATLPGNGLKSIVANVRTAYALQYGEIFKATAIVCLVGAVLGLFIGSHKARAKEPEPDEVTQIMPIDR